MPDHDRADLRPARESSPWVAILIVIVLLLGGAYWWYRSQQMPKVEEPAPAKGPEPEASFDDMWGFGKKDKKKKGKTVIEEVAKFEEPVPEPEPETVVADDVGWGSFSTSKKDKKKKGKNAFEEPVKVSAHKDPLLKDLLHIQMLVSLSVQLGRRLHDSCFSFWFCEWRV